MLIYVLMYSLLKISGQKKITKINDLWKNQVSKCSTVSDTFFKSVITIPVNKPLNVCNLMWSTRWTRQELLKPDWNGYTTTYVGSDASPGIYTRLFQEF